MWGVCAWGTHHDSSQTPLSRPGNASPARCRGRQGRAVGSGWGRRMLRAGLVAAAAAAPTHRSAAGGSPPGPAVEETKGVRAPHQNQGFFTPGESSSHLPKPLSLRGHKSEVPASQHCSAAQIPVTGLQKHLVLCLDLDKGFPEHLGLTTPVLINLISQMGRNAPHSWGSHWE